MERREQHVRPVTVPAPEESHGFAARPGRAAEQTNATARVRWTREGRFSGALDTPVDCTAVEQTHGAAGEPGQRAEPVGKQTNSEPRALVQPLKWSQSAAGGCAVELRSAGKCPASGSLRR